jgi:outer membrane immunogenic protein
VSPKATDGVRKAGPDRCKFAATVVQSDLARSSGPDPIRRHRPSRDERLSTPYAVGNWLLYATGGAALAQVDTNATAALGPFFAVDNRSQSRTGWTLGGGAEVEFAPRWTAKIEYLHVDLGDRTTTFLLSPPISNTSRLDANVITTGVNYRF